MLPQNRRKTPQRPNRPFSQRMHGTRCGALCNLYMTLNHIQGPPPSWNCHVIVYYAFIAIAIIEVASCFVSGCNTRLLGAIRPPPDMYLSLSNLCPVNARARSSHYLTACTVSGYYSSSLPLTMAGQLTTWSTSLYAAAPTDLSIPESQTQRS